MKDCPNNHMLAAVLTTVVFLFFSVSVTSVIHSLVFWVSLVSAFFGALAISKASKVKGLFASSLFQEAEMASRKAGMWCKVAWLFSITSFGFFLEIILLLR